MESRTMLQMLFVSYQCVEIAFDYSSRWRVSLPRSGWMLSRDDVRSARFDFHPVRARVRASTHDSTAWWSDSSENRNWLRHASRMDCHSPDARHARSDQTAESARKMNQSPSRHHRADFYGAVMRRVCYRRHRRRVCPIESNQIEHASSLACLKEELRLEWMKR